MVRLLDYKHTLRSSCVVEPHSDGSGPLTSAAVAASLLEDDDASDDEHHRDDAHDDDGVYALLWCGYQRGRETERERARERQTGTRTNRERVGTELVVGAAGASMCHVPWLLMPYFLRSSLDDSWSSGWDAALFPEGLRLRIVSVYIRSSGLETAQ